MEIDGIGYVTLDPGAEKIIRQLEKAGYEAYAVGGCVRDLLIGNVPADWDITTSARPENVKALFLRTFDTGIEHGTVTVMDGSVGYEVTTFRIDGKYLDHRRPDSVSFARSLYEDVARRDFTINAMACHPEKGIVDYFRGREDLEKGIIRCVGEPERRFEEDALRMLRAVRFSAKLNFDIEPKTWEAMMKLAPTLEAVSKERILEELTKTLMSDHPEKIELARRAGLTPCFARELEDGAKMDFSDLSKVKRSRILRFAVLFCGYDPEKAGRILRQMKADNDLRTGVVHLLGHLKDVPPNDGESMRRWLFAVGKGHISDLIELREACGIDDGSKRAFLEKLTLQEWDAPVSLPELAIDGRVLKEMGVPQGKQIGEALNYLLDQVLKDPSVNEKEQLIAIFQNR